MDKPKILIVDDDPDLRRALKIRLRANHYDTVQASDGYSAISVAQKENPSLIILDLGLPAGDAAALLIDPATGAPVTDDAVPLHLRKARTTRVSIEANAGICRGMLRHRYDSAGQGEENQ